MSRRKEFSRMGKTSIQVLCDNEGICDSGQHLPPPPPPTAQKLLWARLNFCGMTRVPTERAPWQGFESHS